MEDLIELDRVITVAINAAGNDFWDPIMLFFSKVYVWYPLYLAVIAVIFIKNRSRMSVAWISLLFFIVVLLISDQGAGILRDTVCRLRPNQDPSLEGLLRLPANKAGLYGFISSHAANAFAFALMSSALLKRRWYTVAIFLWASIVAFSRVYLAKHFMGDVLCGALFGLVDAALMLLIHNYIQTRWALRAASSEQSK